MILKRENVLFTICSLPCLTFLFFLNFHCVDSTNTLQGTYPELNYASKTIVSFNDMFLGEGLNKPAAVRYLPNTNEFVVLDVGNVCFYVFSNDGTFVRKIGRKGQGPGELLNPLYFDTGADGSLYVYEMGNRRISIFSKEGKFISSFRLSNILGYDPGLSGTGFFVTGNGEILLNQPRRGYYITVYSKEGKILREIGEIIKYRDRDRSFNAAFAEGFPFKDENGNFYIFLSNLGRVKIFNRLGVLLKDDIIEIPEIRDKMNHFPSPEKMERMMLPVYFSEIIFKDDHFYLVIRAIDKENDKFTKLLVYVLDKKLKIKKKINALRVDTNNNIQDLFDRRELSRFLYGTKFDILSDNEEIVLPVRYKSEILKLYPEK